MEAGPSVGDGLLPGLPEELVQSHVLPRLPWYTRPVCRALSKSWLACIDTSKTRPELKLKTRIHQLPRLRGLCVLCTFDTQMFISREGPSKPSATYSCFQWQDHTYQIHRQWRKLPPLRDLLHKPPNWVGLVASSGMVYVWSSHEPRTSVLKMDMGGGDWTWNKFPVPHSFNSLAVAFMGKVYVPQVPSSTSGNEKHKMVLAHDMLTDQSEQVKAWNRDNLSVLPKRNFLSQGEEQMFSYEEDESNPDAELELLAYDAHTDTWRTQDKIPIPDCRWSELLEVKLLDAACFELTPAVGTNTVWIDSEGEVISWFNPSLHTDWVEFNYNTTVKGKCLEYIQVVHGLLYGVFIEEDDDDDEEDEQEIEAGRDGEEQRNEQLPGLRRRSILKGWMCETSSDVQWQEAQEVGCFRESYYVQHALVSPIDHYTFMA